MAKAKFSLRGCMLGRRAVLSFDVRIKDADVDWVEMDLIEQVAKTPARIGILDGGQATHLEDLGFDLSSPLWSASLLAEDSPESQSAIRKVHTDYLAAGAQLIGTLTYQLSDLACIKAGWDETSRRRLPDLWERALSLAKASLNEYHGDAAISLSLGPYGAALANGSEYTGEYQGATFTEMVNFHKGRLRQAFACPSASCIAFVAFETIPRLDEAEAILQALDDLKSEVPRQPPAYLSFVFTPESQSCLPWQGSTPKQALDVIRTHAERPKSWPIAGVGINCTKPTLMSKVVGEFNAAAKSRKLSLFLYPDGGLVWDGLARCWTEPSQLDDQNHWSRELYDLAQEACGTWCTLWIGGCCKTGPKSITELRELVDSAN